MSNNSSFYSPYLFASTDKSTLEAFGEHVFDASFQGRKELMNTLQYGFLAAAFLMPVLAGIDAVVPEVNFHTHTVLLLFEIAAQLLLQMLAMIFVHRVVTFVPTFSGVQHSPVALSGALIPFLIIMFSLHTKLSAKATIVGDRWRHYWRLRPRQLPARAGSGAPLSASAAGTTGGLDSLFATSAASGGGGGGGSGGGSSSFSLPLSTSAAGSSGAPPGTVALGSLPYHSPPPASAVLGSGW